VGEQYRVGNCTSHLQMSYRVSEVMNNARNSHGRNAEAFGESNLCHGSFVVKPASAAGFISWVAGNGLPMFFIHGSHGCQVFQSKSRGIR